MQRESNSSIGARLKAAPTGPLFSSCKTNHTSHESKQLTSGNSSFNSGHFNAFTTKWHSASAYSSQIRGECMKILALHILFGMFGLLASESPAWGAAQPQVFDTSAGPIKITPVNHASTLLEAGGK